MFFFFLHFRVSYLYKYLVVKRMGMCIDLNVLSVRNYFIGVVFTNVNSFWFRCGPVFGISV